MNGWMVVVLVGSGVLVGLAVGGLLLAKFANDSKWRV
jgi:hypothetical protein